MDFKWPMKKRKVQLQHSTQLEPNADEILPISRWESYTVEDVLLEEVPTLLDSLSLDLPRPAQTTFKPAISWQMSFSTALEARELNPSFMQPTVTEAPNLKSGPPVSVTLEARGSPTIAPAPAMAKVRFSIPEPSAPSVEPLHRLRLKLTNLIEGQDFKDMSIPQVLEQLQQIIKIFAPAGIEPAPVSPKLNAAAVTYNREHPDRVHDHIKEQILKEQIPKGLNFKSKPIIGFTAYVGSPANGEMIIANAGVVNNWLTFIRSAASKKVLNKEGGLVKASDLSLLVNLVEIPGGRHSFNLNYGEESSFGCEDPSHTHFTWRSGSYPCTVRSCRID